MTKTYNTNDLQMAAFLKTMGHELIEVDRSSQRATFCFEDSDQLKEDALVWMNDHEVSMKPRTFSSTFRTLKGFVAN